MLFTTPLFLFVFLPLFLSSYYLVPNTISAKNAVALIASIVFFAWGEPVFVFALFLGTYFDYRISTYITPESQLKLTYKKLLLALAISLNVLILIISKYLNFICSEFMPTFTPNLPLILGISFITFHKVSYLVDSYNGRALPPRHFFDCALYIFLFPQLIAGPIIRYHDIGHQIHTRQHTSQDFILGFLRFTIGLIKKLLLADTLGMLSDKVFNYPPSMLSPLFAWGGIIAYTLQIYFDFSGYSDMAIGLARMIGFRFPENFNRPYIARSITEFWQRWHISLSNWMRLYLYIPLGGNRGTALRTYLNLWIVFLISGLWHGSSWNFIAWGAYYGLFLSLERAFSASRLSKNIKLPNVLCRSMTLLIVIIGWVFFRSPTLTYALDYILVLFGMHSVPPTAVIPWGLIFSNHAITALFIGSIFATTVIPQKTLIYFQKLKSTWFDTRFTGNALVITLQFLMAFVFLVLATGAMLSSGYTPFLYFRF